MGKPVPYPYPGHGYGFLRVRVRVCLRYLVFESPVRSGFLPLLALTETLTG